MNSFHITRSVWCPVLISAHTMCLSPPNMSPVQRMDSCQSLHCDFMFVVHSLKHGSPQPTVCRLCDVLCCERDEYHRLLGRQCFLVAIVDVFLPVATANLLQVTHSVIGFYGLVNSNTCCTVAAGQPISGLHTVLVFLKKKKKASAVCLWCL